MLRTQAAGAMRLIRSNLVTQAHADAQPGTAGDDRGRVDEGCDRLWRDRIGHDIHYGGSLARQIGPEGKLRPHQRSTNSIIIAVYFGNGW